VSTSVSICVHLQLDTTYGLGIGASSSKALTTGAYDGTAGE
jgi:hypothetical protein